MKTIKLLFCFLIALLAFTTSCKKISKKDRVVYGQIADSAKAPIANTTFSLIVLKLGSGITSVDEEKPFSFVTDASGNFRVTFQSENDRELMITYPGVTIFGENAGMPYWNKHVGKDMEFDAGVVTAQRK